jgi:hypothetical protein
LAVVMQDAELPGAADDIGIFGGPVGFQGIDQALELCVGEALAGAETVGGGIGRDGMGGAVRQ